MNGIREKRQSLVKEYTPDIKNEKTWGKLITKNLPFDLTKDQTDAGKQLQKLIYKKNPFSVLLQGDVGSGKTLVALLAAMEYLEEGIQVAMMAPTEILARQHYRNFINYIADLPMLRTELVLGAEKASDKRARVDRIKRGDSLLVVGTHSLIQKDVGFHNLGLVIIDEQHRFGVEQRETLQNKGHLPDVLSMSATPIPRSLTILHYHEFQNLSEPDKNHHWNLTSQPVAIPTLALKRPIARVCKNFGVPLYPLARATDAIEIIRIFRHFESS